MTTLPLSWSLNSAAEKLNPNDEQNENSETSNNID